MKSSSRRIRATCTTRPSAPSACASSKWAPLRSSKRRLVREPRWSTSSPVRTQTQARSARERSRRWHDQKHVPVLVDAAAEILTVPNVHLENGATLVGYSGGKCIRGPQSAGLLLGRKDLVQAAWVHSAPHHGFARSMKVGKEEAIGMLMAVEMWMTAGPQGRVEPMALMARRHREARVHDRWRHDVDYGNDGAVEPHAVAVDSMGSEAARHHRRGRREASIRHRAANRHAGRTGSGRRDQHLDHAVHDGGRRREDRGRADSRAPLESAEAGRAGAERRRPPWTSRGQWDVRIEYTREHVHAYAASEAGGQSRRRHASGRLRRHAISSARSTETSVQMSSSLYRAARRCVELPLHRHRRGDAMSGTLDMGEYLTAKWRAKTSRLSARMRR